MSDIENLKRALAEATEYLDALKGASPKQDFPEEVNKVRIAQENLDDYMVKNPPTPEPVVEAPKKAEPVKPVK